MLIFTTSTAEREVQQAYKLGCNAYVVKPYSLKDLTSVIDGLLNHWLGQVRLPQ